MCVIVMYKLSVGHTKIFCDFFASMTGFRQNSAEFFTKPAGIRWPNYRQIRPIIRLIRPNFVVPKFPCATRQLHFGRIFLVFNEFF
jgi:hypothetical protein